jgi:hypothetical protein
MVRNGRCSLAAKGCSHAWHSRRGSWRSPAHLAAANEALLHSTLPTEATAVLGQQRPAATQSSSLLLHAPVLACRYSGNAPAAPTPATHYRGAPCTRPGETRLAQGSAHGKRWRVAACWVAVRTDGRAFAASCASACGRACMRTRMLSGPVGVVVAASGTCRRTAAAAAWRRGK